MQPGPNGGGGQIGRAVGFKNIAAGLVPDSQAFGRSNLSYNGIAAGFGARLPGFPVLLAVLAPGKPLRLCISACSLSRSEDVA